MKYIIPSFLLLSISLSLFSLPTIAKDKDDLRFYCDLQNREQPTTSATVKGQKKLYVLIEWKYPAPKGKTKAQHCKDVSERFQKNWERGVGFGRIVSRKRANGTGAICAVSDEAKSCENADVLFTIKNIQEANEIIYRLREKLDMKTPPPIYQSDEPQSFDLGAWIDAQFQDKTGDRGN